VANISYTESENLKISLTKIDTLRYSILLAVIKPKAELKLRWDAGVDRVFWSLALSESPLTKSEISHVLKSNQIKISTPPQKEAIKFKNALDYINHNYLSTKKAIEMKDVISISDLLSSDKLGVKRKEFEDSLAYFKTSDEHPVIQAGLIHYLLYVISGKSTKNNRFASLLSYLFLYKEGFDYRGFLVLDEYFRKNFTDYELALTEAANRGTQTLWLEYFSGALVNSLSKAQNAIQEANNTPYNSTNTFTTLNDRQKGILTFLERPGTTITNRDVQRKYKVSQITASRDLTSLATQLLILTHGKGRSVYYTKV